MQKYEDFSADAWANCISAVLLGNAPQDGPPAIDAHDWLETAFRRLNSKVSRNAFGQALVRCLRATRNSADESERIYTLLNLTALVRPEGADQLLLQRLTERAWEGFRYGEQDLLVLAITVSAKYEVTDDLANTLEARMLASDDRQLQFAALTAFSRRNDDRTIRLLERVLPGLVSVTDVESLMFIVHGALLRMGCQKLYFWYCNRNLALLTDLPETWPSFVTALHKVLGRFLKDPYAALLLGEIESLSGILPLTQVLDLCSQWPVLGEDVVAHSLHRIWINSSAYGVPWVAEAEATPRFSGAFLLPKNWSDKHTGALVNQHDAQPIDTNSTDAFLLQQAVGEHSTNLTDALRQCTNA